MSTELLVGIILIVLGILLGAAAYMVLSTRKGDQAEEDGEESEISEEEGDEDLPALPRDEVTVQDELSDDSEITEDQDSEDSDLINQVDEIDQAEMDIPLEDAGKGLDIKTEDDEMSEPEEEEPGSTVMQDVPEPEHATPEPEMGPRIQVATLLRDEVSGQLIVQVGDHEYQSADELRDSGDWTRIEFAASDLSKWIDQPIERPSLDREPEAVDRVKPMSMIEQINQILQAKIEASGQDSLAVRLIEGSEGTARVLIGVHSYELGEVPDESISNLIREAVAEWEAGA